MYATGRQRSCQEPDLLGTEPPFRQGGYLYATWSTPRFRTKPLHIPRTFIQMPDMN